MTQDTAFIKREVLQDLILLLQQSGYRCVGPQVRDGTIVYDTIDSIRELPQGYTETQLPGSYRIQKSHQQRYFAWANGPQALKPLTFAARESLWSCSNKSNNVNAKLDFTATDAPNEKLAVIGVRACDLAALYIQDRHFLQQDYRDPYYLARRQQILIVAVNCTHPADTCFCASTGDGPDVRYGHDIALTELDDGFVISVHSELGKQQLKSLALQDITDQQVLAAAEAIALSTQQQKRRLPSRNLKQALFDNLEHSRWHEVAERCLSCGNCTAVCPTCFCHREIEEPSLNGQTSTHYRDWDSCFTPGHSYIHGVTIRDDTRMRYRQWLTHKLGSWHDQYGRSGCVGCGRCITWCPVGIDITEEATAITAGSLNLRSE